MNTDLFVLQHHCLGYVLLTSQVVEGLDCVLDDGLLPAYYQGVFQKAALLCDEIVRDGHKIPYSIAVDGVCDATIWFSFLSKCHPEIYEYFTTYDDVDGVSETLKYLGRDDSSSYAYSVEWILTVQQFFVSLWVAVAGECAKEGIVVDINPAVFPETSLRLQ